jgi:predicted DNA-binding WGR domain protein
MLYDSIRDLYVVFTRWGRIGEDGMNQRTPFNKLDEAKKEFCTIFKQKTGNDFEDLSKFARVPKKYFITKVNYVPFAHQDYLAPFDFEKCPKSSLEKNKRQLLEEVANITMYQKAITNIGIDKDILPISCLNKDVVDKAKDILLNIGKLVKEDQD